MLIVTPHPMTITGEHIIASTFTTSSGEAFRATNPVTGEALPTEFHEASEAEINQAAEQAEAAFLVYRKKSGAEKAEFLERIGEEIMNLGDELVERCQQETALPAGRLQGERGRTVNQLNMFAQLLREGWWVNARIDTAQPDRQPLPKPDIRQMQIALGPVGIFGASNFPLAFSVAGGDTASALAAGCTIVVKGHPAHPGTSELVGRAIVRAAEATGMPKGVFSLVQGTTTEVGQALVKHPLIKAVGFTGSFRGGKALFDAANQRPEPIPVYAEMGSINPVFVLPGALQERSAQIAEGLVGSVTLGVGQFCTNPGLVTSLASEDTENFLAKVQEGITASETGAMLTGRISDAYREGADRMKHSRGVDPVGQGPSADVAATSQALVFRSTVQNFTEQEQLSEEVFGPSTLHVSAQTKEELLALARQLDGHLTATLHATDDDLREYADLVDILERKVGRLLINGFPTGVEVCHSMVHGGPYPATTDSRTTSVGTLAIQRFSRPVCYQNFPDFALPDALKDDNPLDIWRLFNGEMIR